MGIAAASRSRPSSGTAIDASSSRRADIVISLARNVACACDARAKR
jgi:hypothetical protein